MPSTVAYMLILRELCRWALSVLFRQKRMAAASATNREHSVQKLHTLADG